MVQVGLFTVLMTLNKSGIFTVIQKATDVHRTNFYVNIEKFTLFHRILDRLSYWSSSEEDIIFIFNSKTGNALCTSSTFLPEVFKPQTEK